MSDTNTETRIALVSPPMMPGTPTAQMASIFACSDNWGKMGAQRGIPGQTDKPGVLIYTLTFQILVIFSFSGLFEAPKMAMLIFLFSDHSY